MYVKVYKKRHWKIDLLKWLCRKIYSSYMKYKNITSKHLDIISLVFYDHECLH